MKFEGSGRRGGGIHEVEDIPTRSGGQTTPRVPLPFPLPLSLSLSLTCLVVFLQLLLIFVSLKLHLLQVDVTIHFLHVSALLYAHTAHISEKNIRKCGQ